MKPEQRAVPDDPEATVVLSPLLERDIQAIARWYAKATMLAGSPISLSDLRDSTNHRRIVVLTDGVNEAPFGLIAVALDAPEPGWATVTLLAIARQEERDIAALGVALLEAAIQGDASRIRAGVPLDVGLPAGQAGLALYFWLRLGYRPVVSGERLWMVRDLDA